MKHLRCRHVTWSHLHGPLKLPKRLPPAPLLEVDAPKVHEGELARLVAPRLLGLLQPGNGLVELPLLHQIDPDVVIRIPEMGVDLDRPEALSRGLRQSALEAQGPPQEGMRLGRGVNRDGTLVVLDRPVQLSLHLVAVGRPPELRGRLRCSGSSISRSPLRALRLEPALRILRGPYEGSSDNGPQEFHRYLPRMLIAKRAAGHFRQFKRDRFQIRDATLRESTATLEHKVIHAA